MDTAEISPFEYGLIDFTRPDHRDLAIEHVAAMGEEGISLLESLFSGSAVNEHGIPYRLLSQCLYCGVKTVHRMGGTARRLTPYLNEILLNDCMGVGAEAALALGCIPDPSLETVHALAKGLSGEGFAAIECAATVIRLGLLGRPEILEAVTALSENCEREILRVGEVC